MQFNALIPELTVTNLQASLNCYRALGFRLEYERPKDRFAFLSLEGAQLMLEPFHPSGWNVAALERPLGRGINLQIEVDEIGSMLDTLKTMAYPLSRSPREHRRRIEKPANR
jgi:hypothetical protein